MSSSWQPPLAKLIGLVVVLPFAATYLHLYYHAYWKNEYCFVGPHASFVSGIGYYDSLVSNGEGSPVNVAGAGKSDNNLRGETRTGHTATADDALFARFLGIYAPIPQKKKKGKGQNDLDRRRLRQIHSPDDRNDPSTTSRSFLAAGGWPSATQSSVMVSSPSSQLSNHRHLHDRRRDSDENSDRAIAFEETKEGKRWCLKSASKEEEEGKWCSDPLGDDHPDGTIYIHPPSGVWKPVSSSPPSSKMTSAPSLRVSCPALTTSAPSENAGGHKQQNAKQNQNVQFLLNHPATTLLLALNVGLAFHYWNHRINPSTVCKQYAKIVEGHEWWRGLTGATAHFEPLHIGFNMMSLHTLGKELEGGFGSIVFLVYNVALVAFTTAVMMGMVYLRLWWIQRRLDRTSDLRLQSAYQEQQARLRETSSVGFSAVLFAWMVVSTMERKQPTCPVPFFSDVCFSTYSIPGMPFLKFNVSPIVSLFVAQFIMPRVSFMGHLAGIICGFCLHWGWVVPPLEVCSANVLIGGVFLLGLIWRRRVIPVRPLLTVMMDKEGCVEHEDYLRSLLANGVDTEVGGVESTNPPLGQNANGSGSTMDPFMRSKQKKKERELNEFLRKQKTLRSVRYLIGIVTLASFIVFDWRSSLVLSQCVLLASFTFGAQSSLIVWAYTRSKEPIDIIEPERLRSGMIWRGFFASAVLAIVVDSMSMASWFAFPTLIASEQNNLLLGLLPASVFMVLRTAVNFLALVLCSKILHDTSQVGGGIFSHVFSMVIRWSRLIGDHGVFMYQKPLWTAFEGRGITLGRGG